MLENILRTLTLLRANSFMNIMDNKSIDPTWINFHIKEQSEWANNYLQNKFKKNDELLKEFNAYDPRRTESDRLIYWLTKYANNDGDKAITKMQRAWEAKLKRDKEKETGAVAYCNFKISRKAKNTLDDLAKKQHKGISQTLEEILSDSSKTREGLKTHYQQLFEKQLMNLARKIEKSPDVLKLPNNVSTFLKLNKKLRETGYELRFYEQLIPKLLHEISWLDYQLKNYQKEPGIPTPQEMALVEGRCTITSEMYTKAKELYIKQKMEDFDRKNTPT